MSWLQQWIASRRGVVVVLALIWLAHLAGNTIHIIGDQRGLQLADAANQVDYIYQYVAGLRHGGLAALWQELCAASIEWPPLAHFVLGLSAALIDPSLAAVRLYNMLFFGLLLVGVAWCGAQVAGRSAGLLAAALCSLLPAIHGMSRQIGLDFPATAMVTLTAAALMASDGFVRRRYAVLGGLLGGLAALTRGQSLFFLVGVGLWQLLRGLRRPELRGRVLGHAALCALLVLGLTSLWWWGHLGGMIGLLGRHADAQRLPLEGDPSLWGGIRLYVGGMYRLTSLPLLLVLLVTGAQALRRRVRLRGELLLWLLVPLALHIVLVVRNPRYLLPLVPVLAILASAGALSWSSARLRRIFVALLLGLGAVVWLAGLRHSDRLRRRLGAAQDAVLGSLQLNRPGGADPMYRPVRRLLAALTARLPARGPVLLMLRHGPRRFNYTLQCGAMWLRTYLPGLVVHHSRRGPTPWQAAAMKRAAARFVLAVAGTPPPAGALQLTRVALRVAEHAGPLNRRYPPTALVLYQLPADSDWRPPPEGME